MIFKKLLKALYAIQRAKGLVCDYLKKREKLVRLIALGLIAWVMSTLFTTFVIYKTLNSGEYDNGRRNRIKASRAVRHGSVREQLKELRRSHDAYRKATPGQLLDVWTNRFIDAEYRRNGNVKFRQYDCISAVYHFLVDDWGANLVMENVEGLNGRAEKLNKDGRLKIRKSYNDICPGDLIIFTPISGRWHVGVVYDKKSTRGGRRIYYVDVNAYDRGMGVYSLEHNSSRIHKIIEVSYALWIGDLYDEWVEEEKGIREKIETLEEILQVYKKELGT